MSGLKVGLELNVRQLDQLISMTAVELPEFGTGHAGRIVKYDKAKTLIEHYFPQPTTPASEQSRMINAILGKHTLKTSECPEAVLDLCSQFDPENKSCFDKLAKVAIEHKNALKKSGPPTDSADAAAAGTIHDGASAKWASYTPSELWPLLPGKHALPHVYLRHLGDAYVGIYHSVRFI